MIADLGGEGTMSHAQISLCRRAIWLELMVEPECVNNFETPVVGSLVSNAALPRVRVAWVLES